MTSKEYVEKLKTALAGRGDVTVASEILRYASGRHEFLRLASREIGPADKVMLVRAGIHGEETAGPLTMLKHAGEIFDRAAARGVKLIVYPLGNPSGFEAGTRYNADGDRGDAGNNDFLRYELADGRLVDDLGAGGEFRRWLWSSDPAAQARLPLETLAMHRALRADPLTQIKAVLDLHQDLITPDAPPAAYHYSFGDLAVYAPIVSDLAAIVPLWRNTPIGAGFDVRIQASGLAAPAVADGQKIMSDDRGFIVRHDGTLPDLLWRLGAPYCVTAETTGAVPPERADAVNLRWLYGLVDLAAGG